MSLSPLPFGDMGGTKLTFSLGGNIYGIFSLVSGQKLTMKPSYTTNAAEIYLHSTLGLIESTQSLRVIYLAGVGVFETKEACAYLLRFLVFVGTQKLALRPPLT